MPAPPRLDKRLRLAQWALTHRVDPVRELNTADLAKVLGWFGGIAVHDDPVLRSRWTEFIRPVLQRRARRRGWLERHGSVPKGWTPPRGWEARPDVKPPVRMAGPSKKEQNKPAWRTMLGPSCRQLAAMRREEKAAIRARWEAKSIAAGYDPKTGRRVKAEAA